MRALEGLSRELKGLLEKNTFTNSLLSKDVLLILGCGGLMLINDFLRLGMFGSVVGFVGYYGFFLGIILAFANNNSLFIYGGFGIYTALRAWDFLTSMMNRYFGLGDLLATALFGYLTYVFYTMAEKEKKAVE